MIQLFTPNGKSITGTLEVVYGRCGLTGLTRSPDGSLDVEHDGSGTDIDWNSQKTVERFGQRVFLDEDGNEWLENQLQVREVSEECEMGLHNWVSRSGKLDPSTKCGLCGELYGDPS